MMIKTKKMFIIVTCILSITVGIYLYKVVKSQENLSFSENYTFGTEAFNKFVMDSYSEAGNGEGKNFYSWMDETYIVWRDNSLKNNTFPFSGSENLNFQDMRGAIKKRLSDITDITEKTREELVIMKWLHKYVKTIIPRFSLQRGYEFVNVVKYGERQCFLQSILIAGLLQDMGMEAGVVMVYKNEKGEETNNGHAVVLGKLFNGQDILVDASDAEPFAAQKGLFVKTSGGYKYVLPIYQDLLEKNNITGFIQSSDNQAIDVSNIITLDCQFLTSQFDVYRGEWISGGLHEKEKTRVGLERAFAYFQKSVNECYGNPLALYFLARTYEELGDTVRAKGTFREAYTLYSQYGWIPQELIRKTN